MQCQADTERRIDHHERFGAKVPLKARRQPLRRAPQIHEARNGRYGRPDCQGLGFCRVGVTPVRQAFVKQGPEYGSFYNQLRTAMGVQGRLHFLPIPTPLMAVAAPWGAACPAASSIRTP